ncbi:hypothetical protein EYC84_001848 [Monilinia fructicola]|uniref:Uncharacterized protein n=1 Tax=Monilinia fructicola TaxID=38448 RepID=A0A5M9JT83_MONFR|nr:hypothetical protein EYC84_001848 [Monilinia fructicola]
MCLGFLNSDDSGSLTVRAAIHKCGISGILNISDRFGRLSLSYFKSFLNIGPLGSKMPAGLLESRREGIFMAAPRLLTVISTKTHLQVNALTTSPRVAMITPE